MTASTPEARASAIAWAVALTIHAVAAVAIVRFHGGDFRPPAVEAPVEIDVPDPPAPPPDLRPQPVAEPQPEPRVAPRVVPRLHIVPKPVRARISEAPPPPNQQPPAEAPRNAPPVFGVTMSSVVSGERAMAVPVGNTTMTKNRSLNATATPPQAYAGGRARAFEPVPEIYVAMQPRKLYEVNSAEIYPPEPRTLGIEGTVKLSVDLDEKGNVVAVRLIQRAGHGFDEAAMRAMPRFRFSPAVTSDGRAVPYRFAYQYRFTIAD